MVVKLHLKQETSKFNSSSKITARNGKAIQQLTGS